MLTLRVFAQTDTERPIATLAELHAALPAAPELPSLYCLDGNSQSVQLEYGSPRRDQYTVKLISAYGVDKHVYDSVNAATTAFLKLAADALK